MTGEMAYINPETGIDSNGESWPIHLAIAKGVGGTLKAFDSYQGPYIAIGNDVRVGNPPYEIPINHLGCVRLWVCYENEYTSYVYREDIDDSISFETWCEDVHYYAIRAALELLKEI